MGNEWWSRRTSAFDDPDDAAAAPAAVKSRRSYLDDMWGRYGFDFDVAPDATLLERGEALVTAHGMVKSFVDTFATEDVRYNVTFDPSIGTAGTDLDNKRVTISPAPVLDPTIDSTTAGMILTAMAAHEASHIRYGRKTFTAVRRKWEGTPDFALAMKIANVLDDVRIDARYTTEYPGYKHVFKPAIDYVAAANLPKDANGLPILVTPDRAHQAGIMTLATRYPMWAVWDGFEEDLKWWREWAAKFTADDTAKLHVAGVEAALERIKEPPPPPPPPEPAPDEGDGAGDDATDDSGESAAPDDAGDDEAPAGGADTDGMMEPGDKPGDPGAGGSGDPDDADDEDAEGGVTTADDGDDEPETGPGSDIGSGITTDDVPLLSREEAMSGAEGGGGAGLYEVDPDSPLPDCAASAIGDAAKRNGAADMGGEEAQRVVNELLTTEVIPGMGSRRIDVRRTTDLQTRSGKKRAFGKTAVNGRAAAAIRQALMLSRTGHTGIDRGQTRGRIDSGSLYRVALTDSRLFHRRKAPDPGRYLMWVLADCSGSMSTSMTELLSATKAIAEASRHVPSIRMEVFGWTSPDPSGRMMDSRALYGGNDGWGHGVGVIAGAYSAWRTGEPVDKVDSMQVIRLGGTPDSYVLRWAVNAMPKMLLPGEQGVIFMMTDGLGHVAGIAEAADIGRRVGKLEVIGVGIGAGASRPALTAAFGKSVIPWAGSVVDTMRAVGKRIGRIVTVR